MARQPAQAKARTPPPPRPRHSPGRSQTSETRESDAAADAPAGNGSAQDAVLGNCADFEHSPIDGKRCRQSFMACLDCSNARAFPRHLPVQLVVADRLRDLRKEMPIGQWITDHAGPLAQLDDIFAEYEQAQLTAARAEITDSDHRTVNLLLSGNLEAS